MSLPAPSTPAEATTAWLERIASVQRDRSTPEELDQLRQREQIARRTKLMAKKAGRVKQAMSLSASAWSQSVQDVSETPMRSAEVGSRGMSAMALLSSPKFISTPAAARRSSLEEEEEEEEELEQELALAVQAQVAEGALTADAVELQRSGEASAAAQAEAASLSTALAQLEKEPDDEAACAAKFGLYEAFAKTVEDARQSTLQLWEQSMEAFDAAPATKAAIARDIKQVDREENLGIVDDPRRWFVHGMCKTAARNQKTLNGVLTGITTKLELLASQSECPICFEAFSEERPSTTLGCAHKACTDCWTHWSALNGGHMAVCPLCRHEEFVSRVLHAAGSGP